MYTRRLSHLNELSGNQNEEKMTIIERSKDCGNSPKNQLVEDITVAILTGDGRTVSRLVTDDIQWKIVGGDTFYAREAILQAIERTDSDSILKLTIWHVMSHGKSGAANGTIQYQDSERGFCHVFEFGNAKGLSIRAITSYQIEI